MVVHRPVKTAVAELTELIEKMDLSISNGKDPGRVLGQLRRYHPDFRSPLNRAFDDIMSRRAFRGGGVLGARHIARRLLKDWD
jgi:hypothetical protein